MAMQNAKAPPANQTIGSPSAMTERPGNEHRFRRVGWVFMIANFPFDPWATTEQLDGENAVEQSRQSY